MNIGIFIYDGVEVLDFTGPYEVFSTANRFVDEHINISLIAPSQSPVRTRGGMSVNPHYSIYASPHFDLLIVAGGKHHGIVKNPTILQWLAETAQHTRSCASVCTGVFLYAAAGLIDEKKVTTHQQDIDELKHQYPQLHVIGNVRYIMDQNFTSSAGVSAGIDMSLALLKKRFGERVAKQTAQQMEYLG
ncbi:Isonitrile hydratase [Pseudoalteromonas holothuriae]|uniref:Isonitrile hydratase n=1 Tax=Pseudoalteromonas holothuriae TaxID=2963714 RepID=A0A9W4R2Q3_9GAMM|nr:MULTISPECIES: DJ-1/PfpI family protein [unclassified Pseudoalteromonas]CAH9063704.1 Isonitrile hydratase [Pseudoalteromonas sp. CIP111854]CAH9064699.1 Isonitrile hydratase [Pseudoalteromonas sp. CIP111951]